MVRTFIAALIFMLFVPISGQASPKLQQTLESEVILVSQTVNHCHKICAALRGSAYRECRAPCDGGNTPAAHRKADCRRDCANRAPAAQFVCQRRCESERRRQDF